MKSETLEKLYYKVQKDLEEYEKTYYNCTPQVIINCAVDIYHGQNFFYMIEEFVENFEPEDDYYAISQDTINKIINFKDNIVDFWINNRCDIRHYERYNLEYFDDFVSVLECVMGNIKLKESK